MKNQPSFVKTGDPIKASEYNLVVDQVRKLSAPLRPTVNAKNSRSRPFDVIDTKYEEEEWYVKLKSGYIQDGVTLHYVFYKDENDDHWPLGGVPMISEEITELEQLEFAYPWIKVIPDHTLCVNLLDHKLKWVEDLTAFSSCVPICKFKITEEKFTVTNLNPSNVVKSDNHPLKVNVWPTKPSPLDEDITDCNVTVTSGYVFNIKTYINEQAIDKKVPDNGGDPAIKLDAEEPPVFEGVEADNVVYLYCTVDEKGRFYEEPKIQIDEDPDKESVHYMPEPVASNGEMYYPLAKIKKLTFANEPLGEMTVFVAEQLITGDVTLIQDLPTLKNVGEKREVFKEFEEETSEYKFRTLEQLEGTNSYEIIKKAPTNPTEAADKETIEWKYLTEKASDPQVQLENIDGNKGIRIKGNNTFESLTEVVGFDIVVKDGLVASILKNDLGKDLNLTIKSIQFNNDGQIYGSFTTVAVLYFRRGLFVGTAAPAGAPPAGLLEFEVTQLISAA